MVADERAIEPPFFFGDPADWDGPAPGRHLWEWNEEKPPPTIGNGSLVRYESPAPSVGLEKVVTF